MKNLQRGFIVPLLLLIIAAAIIGGGVYVYTQNKPVKQAQIVATFAEAESVASLKTNWATIEAGIPFRPTHPGTVAWLSPDSVQFIGNGNVLVRCEDGYNPGIAVLHFDGNTFKILETFKDKAEFTLTDWNKLITEYGDPSYPISTYTISLVRNGQIVSFQTLTKVPENVFVKEYAQASNNVSSRYAAFITKAESAGHVRIIVGIKDDFKPTSEMSVQAEDEAQSRNTARLQDALLAKLKGYDAVVNRRLTLLPAIGLTVDATALRALMSWPEVVSIEGDEPIPPAN